MCCCDLERKPVPEKYWILYNQLKLLVFCVSQLFAENKAVIRWTWLWTRLKNVQKLHVQCAWPYRLAVFCKKYFECWGFKLGCLVSCIVSHLCGSDQLWLCRIYNNSTVDFFIMHYFMFKVIRMLFVLCHTDYESKLFSVVCCAFEMICVFPCDWIYN